MHAGKLSNRQKKEVAIEIFNEDRMYLCNSSPEINCSNNGIHSKSKKSKIGFRFIDTASSCAFYTEKMSSVPFHQKYKTIKGDTEFTMQPRKNGILIKPEYSWLSPLAAFDETVMVNCKFDCGNARILFNVSIKDFGELPIISNSKNYIGVIFRYLKISNDEE